MCEQSGTLYGVGVGPGDPELITVKALKLLKKVPVIFAAFSPKNDYSVAGRIVGAHLNGQPLEKMYFPMTRDEAVLKKAWEENARRALDVLDSGRDAAFVTIGDPLVYSTFSYLLRTVKSLSPNTRVVTVPGITSFQASAAMTNTPLAEGEESFHLISGAKGGDNLRRVIESSENVVMLKTYKYFEDIYACLEEFNLLDKTICVSRCGLDGETTVENVRSLKGKKMPYLSLLIIKKRGLALDGCSTQTIFLQDRTNTPEFRILDRVAFQR
jgi:precorrin-2/cobalt-factor-2 C20-methyltransferase